YQFSFIALIIVESNLNFTGLVNYVVIGYNVSIWRNNYSGTCTSQCFTSTSTPHLVFPDTFWRPKYSYIFNVYHAMYRFLSCFSKVSICSINPGIIGNG